MHKGASGICRRILLSLAVLLACSASAQTSAPSIGALKELSVDELMDIEVTSVSKEPEKLSDAASAIQVVTNDEIERSGASSIPEALELAGNLDIAQKNSHDWAISARGFNTALGNKLLVLMDGRSVYTPLYSGVFWDVQDYLLEDIDRIEVISGPGGTLWGANAVNGVINVTTKSAKDTQGLYAEAGGGSELEGFAAVRYGGKLGDDTYYRVYAKHFDRADEVFTSGARAPDSWNQTQAGFRVDAGGPPQGSLTLQGDLYGGSEGIATGGTAKVRGDNILGRWSSEFPDGSSMSLQAYYDHTYLSDPVPAFTLGSRVVALSGILTDALDTYDLDFQYHLSAGGGNRVVWGLGYRFTHDVLTNAPALAFLPPNLDQNLFSAFAQDEVLLARDLSLIFGTKVEHNDYTGTELEPNVRLRYNLPGKQMLWAAVSRAVRTPSRIDRDLSEAAPPNLVVLRGSPDFESETVVAYEVGYRAQIGPRATTSVSAFYNDYDDVRSTSYTPATILPFYFANNLEGDTRGFELSGNYQAMDWWQLGAAYDLLKENLGVKPGKTDINDALNETSDPSTSSRCARQWTCRATSRWTPSCAGWTPYHNNRRRGPVSGTVPAISTSTRAWDGARLKPRISFVRQNLLHGHHPEYGYPGPTRGGNCPKRLRKGGWRYYANACRVVRGRPWRPGRPI